MEVSIVIPVYNEKDSISTTVKEIKETFTGSEILHEIIIVNDGSTDGTEEVLKAFTDENIIVLNNNINRGYGSSIKKGIRSASYNAIFITDADGTYPNRRMPEFVKYYYENELDMLVGCREKSGIPLIRRPAKACLRLFASYISGFKIPDLNSGFRIFNKEYAISFFNLLPEGFSLTSTITLSMFSKNYTVEYLPIDYKKRDGKSKIRPIQDTINFFILVWKTVFYFAPLKTFLPLTFLMFSGGLGVFIYSYLYMEKVMDITTIVMLLTSVQIFCIGLVADLIVKRGK